MFKVNINKNFSLESIKPAIQKSLKQGVLLVDEKAGKNAPYLTGNLRRGINFEVKPYIGIVGVSEKIKYARAREYVNKKNPHKRFYMKRALESSQKEIQGFFDKNIMKLIIKKR